MTVDRFIRGQLIAFVMVTVLGTTYAAVTYLQVPRLLGFGTYEVTLDLPRAGGLYENALVTYRGIEVGKVDRMVLNPTGVRAVLGIDEDVSIPSDVAVSVRSTSAIGEQYVDFEPRSASPPLEDGHVIPGKAVSFPTPTGELLSSVTRLAETVPMDELNTTLDEAYQALTGAGPHADRLLRSASRLQNLADANLAPTTKLVRDLVPVLATQQDVEPQVRSFSGDLAAVTDTIRASDPSIRGSIDKTGPLAQEFDTLLTQLRPTLPQLLGDLTSTGQVLRTYIPNIRHLLVVFPATVASLTSTTAKGIEHSGENPPSMAAMGFKLSLNRPPACVTGFEEDRVPPSELSNRRPPPMDAWCKAPKDSDIAVRGFRHAPCPPGSPTGPGSTGATAAACGWNFQSPSEAEAATKNSIRHMLEVAAKNPRTRAENEEFIGDDDFDGPASPETPPGINGNGNGSNQDEGVTQQAPDGTFTAGGKPFLNGAALPMPEVSTKNGPVTGLQQFLLAPLLAPS